MCTFLPLEGENLSYVRLKFSSRFRRRASIDTGSSADAFPEPAGDLNLHNPESLILEKTSFKFVRMDSGQRVPIDKHSKFSFQIQPLFPR